MDWVSRAPKSFRMYAPNSAHNMLVGGNRSQCVPAYGAPYVVDGDGARRDAVLDDYIRMARLIQQSPHFHTNGGILAQPGDVPAVQSHLVMMFATMLLSDKVLVGIGGKGNVVQDIMNLITIRYGGRETMMAKPRVLNMVCSISPLQVEELSLETLFTAARYRQPLVVSPAPAASISGPIDLAGNLTLATAEALALIGISQMVQPGTPVVFGLQCYGADLRTGNVSIGSPAYALQAKYCAALAKMFKLPSRAGGAVTDAKVVSVQSGYESMLSILISFANRVNLIFHSAGILDSFAAVSFEKFIVDLEMISMVKYYMAGVDALSEKSISIDLIKEVGPGGMFLTTADTLEKCRTHAWWPKIGSWGPRSGADPRETLLKSIEKTEKELLATYQPPVIKPKVLARMESYLKDAGVDQAVIDQVKEARFSTGP